MTERLNAFQVGPDAYKAMLGLQDYVNQSGLEHALPELVKIRASQINRCAYCLHMHVLDARKAGETEAHINLLSAWEESELYTPRERAALRWTEELTRLPDRIIPFLGAAYSRSRELTCDPIGALVARDLKASRSALQMLACGSAKLNAQMNADAFQQQEQLVPGIAGFLLHIFSHYPRLTRRVEAVTQWYRSQGIVEMPVRPAFAACPA